MTLEEKVKQIVVDSLHAEASQVTPAASQAAFTLREMFRA